MERNFLPFIYDRDTGDIAGNFSGLEERLDPEDLVVTFGDDGIGWYEYGSQRCFDSRPYTTFEEESDVGEWVCLIVDCDREDADGLNADRLKEHAEDFLDCMERSYSRDVGGDRHSETARAKLKLEDAKADEDNQTVKFFVTWRDA